MFKPEYGICSENSICAKLQNICLNNVQTKFPDYVSMSRESGCGKQNYVLNLQIVTPGQTLTGQNTLGQQPGQNP